MSSSENLLNAIKKMFINEVTHAIKQSDAMNSHKKLLLVKNMCPSWLPTTVNVLTKQLTIKSAILMFTMIMFNLFFFKVPDQIIADIINRLP